MHRRTLVMLTRLCLAISATLPAGAAEAQTYPVKPGDPVAPTRDSLNAISARGRMLAEYDFIAAAASDSVMARHPDASKLRGYIARQRGNRWDVAFGYPSAAGDTFFVTYEARQRQNDPDNLDVTAFATPRADTGFYARAQRAMDAAKSDFGPQPRPYNAAVLERPRDRTLWVYLVPAQVRAGVFPLGGDARYIFDPDGRTILGKRRLHQAIIEYAAPARTAQGDSLKATTHTAILDNIPEDTDVFHVLVRHPSVPEFVVTDTWVYFITVDGGIGVLGPTRDLIKDGKKVGETPPPQ